MATGDIAGNLEGLRGELGHIKYPFGLNSVKAEAGDPAELLPVLSYALLRFSKHVALLGQGHQLHGKTDQRFVEAAWKFMRDVLGIKPVLTPAQFLSEGFAERKLLLLRQVIKACKDHHNAAARKERLAALKGSTHSEQRLYSAERRSSSQSPKRAVMGKARPAPVTVVSSLAQPSADGSGEVQVQDNCFAGAAAGSRAVADRMYVATPPETTAIELPCLQQQQQQQQEQSQRQPCPPSPEAEQPRKLPAVFLAGLAPPRSMPLLKLHPEWQDTGQTALPRTDEAPTEAPVAMLADPYQAAGLAWRQPGASEGAASSSALLPAPNVGMATGAWPAQLEHTMIPRAVPPTVPANGHATATCSHPLAAAIPRGPPTMPSAQRGYCQPQAQQQPHPQQQQEQQWQWQQHAAIPPPSLPPPSQSQAAGGVPWQLLPMVPAGQELGVAQPAALPVQAGLTDHATWRLIQDLQLRLKLAEDAALEARHAAEQAQESTQARMAVLEGRIKFLESGFALQPPGPAGLLQLPWRSPPPMSPPIEMHQPAGQSALPAQHIRAHWPPPPPQQQQQQQQQQVGTQQCHKQHGHQQPQQLPPRYVPVSLPPASLPSQQDSKHPTFTSSSMPPSSEGAPSLMGPSTCKAEPAGAAESRTFSSTTELINTMRSRFSEAEELLRLT